MLKAQKLFNLDPLAFIIIALAGFVALSIWGFSLRYLKGDRRQKAFYFNLAALIGSVCLMAGGDHLLLLFGAWGSANFFLTRLMLHKAEWEAAKESSKLALKNFGFGLLCLGGAFLSLYLGTGETSISVLLKAPISFSTMTLSSCLIGLAAMTQSGLWPFHTWLTSSLNSPTPVSAMMHAGLVNGGGFILTRFAPLLLQQPQALNALFVLGLVSALLGTLWKLMQSDIKRMLACSTMGQMGFMVVQCGLGLFPAAIAHLCWHGLFKAYLFLASGSAAKEKRLDLEYPPTYTQFVSALFCGLLGGVAFAYTSDKALFAYDTNLILTLIATLTATQFALPIVRSALKLKIVLALLATTLIGGVYGLNVLLIESILEPMGISAPLPINVLHIAGFSLLTMAWLMILFGRVPNRRAYPAWMLKGYVRMLNASQPHPKTVTANRNHYQF